LGAVHPKTGFADENRGSANECHVKNNVFSGTLDECGISADETLRFANDLRGSVNEDDWKMIQTRESVNEIGTP
jgi:hypothetical protein